MASTGHCVCSSSQTSLKRDGPNFQIVVVAREEPKPLGKRAVRDLRVQAALSVG